MSSCNLSTFEELDISEESETTSNFQRGGPLRNSGVRYCSSNKGLFYVNANNFAEMASQSRLIGDKTMFLKDLENDHTIRITMPRRMGKTMILTMLDAFFQIPKEGKPEKPEASSQFNLFCDTLIFKREESFVNQYFGKVPVIYMNLAGVTANTMADYLGLFKSAVQEMCEKFVDIIGVNENEPGLKGICKFMRTACDDWKNLDSNDLTFSIKMLSRLLHHHYGHKVLVLIDEYDTPINYLATAENVSDDECSEIQQFHQKFIINSVKSNQHLWKVVVAGIMRISGKNQSSVTYFECNLLKCNKLSQYFGFNSVEIEKFVKEIKKQCRCEIAEKDMELAKKWYNGYALDIGGETTSFYSPYSMCRFFNEYVTSGGSKIALNAYVSQSSILGHVTAYLKRKEIGDEILQLLVDDNFTISMRDDFEYTNDHLSLLRHACKENYKIIDMNKFKSAMHALLCHLGYLGYKDNKLRIANWEMRHHLNKLLRTYLEITYRFDSQMTAAVVDAIREIATLKTTTTKTLRHAFEAIIKKLPKRTILNESLTHALFTYLTANISEVDLRHEVNFRTKDGKQLRPDLCYQIGGKTTVVVEMKFGNRTNAALACTEAEYYARQLLSNIWTIGTEKFVMLGIHVTKKRVVTIEHSAIERSDIEDDNKENVHVPNKFVNTKNKTKKIQKA